MCQLYHDNTCGSINTGVTFGIRIKPCPLGFELSKLNEYHICACNKWLQNLTDE